MRVMVIVKANERSEAGGCPTTDELDEMGRFNEELVKAGVMLAGEGLTSSRDGQAGALRGGKGTTVIDGPFAETKELVAGFWIWQVASLDEALEWARRAPFPDGPRSRCAGSSRPRTSATNFTPELQEREAALRERAAGTQ